ncbi:MAG: imidazole glycerol phosphate synthase subunit HisH [bacterium]
MSRPEVLIIKTGVANIASLFAAFDRLGRQGRLTEAPEDVLKGEHVVLPGVGAFAAGMAKLRERGLDEALGERIEQGRPTLAVCLGLQLLCEASEESPGVAGLGVVPARVARFDDSVRVPQFGWNQVTPVAGPGGAPGGATGGGSLLEPGFAYFANSFRVAALPDGWGGATSDHGDSFVAALERGSLLACQFHPELSGRWGSDLLARWLAR